jgi:hypothetical protein
MKKIAGLIVFALASMLLVQGQDQGGQNKDKGMEMTGIVCNAGNVVTTDGKSVCDPSKGGKSADMVFIDDQGKATTIANPEKVHGMSGQKVKVKGEMKQIKGEDRMWLNDVAHLSPG